MQRSSRQTAVQQQQPTYEKTIQFQLPNAIVWQIKFIINQISSKKSMTSASNEFENLSKEFGKEFDKYLLRELIDQIDLKDSVKAQRDKNEPFKSQLLSQELARCSLKPEFLLYFSEIAHQSMGDRLADFLAELAKRLRLNFPTQLLIALSISESIREELQAEGLKILKQKLIEYHNYGKPEPLPEYAAHRLLFLLSTHPDLNHDEQLKDIAQYIRESNPMKPQSHVALRLAQSDLMYSCVSQEEPSISLFRDFIGLDNLDKSYRMLEPWQVLLDLGHYSSYNYNSLLKALEEFKDINEKTMAKTLLHLSFNHQGTDDLNSKIVQACFESCKKGEISALNKELSDKKSIMGWSIDNLGRVFRELYSTLNWTKVFDALTEIEDEIILDQKAFSTFLQLFNKAKPQNLQYPLTTVLQSEWQNPALQLNFVENSISFYIEKKERSINFQRTERRYEALEEIPGIKEKHPAELLNVWTCIDLVERLIILSDSHCYTQVRALFDNPLKQIPEYLLLSISMTKPNKGNLLLDELLSFLMPQFLGNHINSLPVLQALWKSNQALMIRGICELCRHDQRVMNLSRVLDITQEVKESLLPIVNCDDYSFAVNLGILAGKRDFLHFDVWLKGRIKDIGTPFIKALLKYLKEQIILPVNEYILRRQGTGGTEEALETHKQQVLERSHLSKEKLCLTIEHLSDLRNSQNPKIKAQTHNQISEVVSKLVEQYPNQGQPLQNSEEIDNAANDYFQKVFSAEPHLVDQKIEELILTMQKFKESDIKKEQEIYACMLHSLFDEYRFLHRYPQQYLEKIAKLFGAIIKHKIIDGTLQDIALKFAFEAFRREGKRQKFGVITIRQFFDMLPQFPQVFEDIYEIRNNIRDTDPQMIKDIEDLYERTMRNRQAQPHEEEKRNEPSKKQDEDKRDSVKHSRNQANESATSSDGGASVHSMPSIDSNKFLQTFQQNASSGRSNQSAPGQASQQNNSQNQPGSQSQRAQQQKNQNQQQQETKTLTASASATAQPFVPSYKKKEQQPEQPKEPAQQPAFQAPTPESSSLNIQSEIFRRTPSNVPNTNTPQNVPPVGRTPNPQIPQGPPVMPSPQQVSNSKQQQMIPPAIFRPANNRSPIPALQQSPHVAQMQQLLDAKIQRAISENFKVRLEDLIEDSNMPGPTPEAQEQIKFICNNTGKNNFATKLEELKALINNQNGQQNLNWFIQYILTKRISSQSSNLHQIYIDMIKQLNTKESISLTLAQAVELFKRCMLIDEEQFYKISQRGSQQGSPVKQYLISLGTFLGLMTVAQNRPILARELDIKQLLVEAYSSEKLKLVVTFVCRIFKECQKSNIFKANNPWIKSILEILKEINDWALQNNHQNQNQDILMEVEAMCRQIGLQGINDIVHSGFLKASQTRQFQSSSQQVEINHLFNKTSLIPAPPAAQPQMQQPQPVNPLQNQMAQNENFRFERQQQQQMVNRAQSISPIPSIGGFNMSAQAQIPFRLQTPTGEQPILQQNQQSFNPILSQQQQLPQQQPAQKLSTQEIYPRVVVSQETLQLFAWLGPQKEQLLRQVVGDAVDSSIVEILSPVVDRSVTIALITTRELVLKDFAYDGDYVKIQNAADMIVQNLAGSLALVTCREPLKMSLTTNLRKFLNQMLSQYRGQGGSESAEPPLTEAQINEVASTASKENLELGCKLIKKSVISKALAKVREDQQMMRAIDQRKQSQGQSNSFFVDQTLIAQFADLPPQLQPNQNGLTDAQFQVYEDFSRLNSSLKKQDSSNADTGAQIQSEPFSNDLGSLLTQVEKRSQLDDVLKFQLAQKLQGSEQQPANLTVEEQQKLWNFCSKSLQAICESLSNSNDMDQIGSIVETLSFIIQNYKLEDLSKRLTQIFLSFSVDIVNNCSLTIKLMKDGIISTAEWDSQIGFQLRDSQQFQIEEKFMGYIINFFLQGVKEEKSFQYNQFPNAIQALEKMSEINPQVARYCKDILEDLRQGSLQSKETLRNYINEWAVLSFEENNPNQEAEINKYFYKLMGLYKDPEVMYNFCKVMVEVSIERALYTADGQKRPSDRLDYRYIESFLKLMAVLLRTNDINKHEFMAKLFEAIHEVLEEDHKSKRTEFNQKPYIRLLINILIAVNNSQSQLFNPKTHLLILFGLADLFSKLNPNKYPAFSFAWLELISHNQFMPLFLAIQGNSQYNNFVGNLQYQSQTPSQAQNRRGGSQAPSQGQPQGAIIQDNTFYQKWFKFKELIVNLFTFLKNNMIPGQKMPTGLHKFYEATLRVVLVIRHDFPEFLSDFYFNFVNSLPEHCIQLRNIILSAQPRVIKCYNPFSRNLKVDTLPEINQKPKTMISYDTQHQLDMPDMNFGDYQVYLNLNNLREDLEKYFRTKQPQLINVICEKMMMSEEVINGRRRINSNIINAVALFIGNNALQKNSMFQQKDCYDMLKKIILNLNAETKWCLLNSLINELRYINNFTYFYSWIVIYLFSDNDESVQEQITRILIERLQVSEPHPWGLCITFRELLQNPKYQFAKKSFVVQNQQTIEYLLQTKLQAFYAFWNQQKQPVTQQQLPQHQQQE